MKDQMENSNELNLEPLIEDLERRWGLRNGEQTISGTNPSILQYSTTLELINQLVPMETPVSSTNEGDMGGDQNDGVTIGGSEDPGSYEKGAELLEICGSDNATLRVVHSDLVESRKRRLNEYGELMNNMSQLVNEDEHSARNVNEDDMMRVSRLLEILYYVENVQAGIRHLMALFSTGTESMRNIPGASSSVAIFGKRFKRGPEAKIGSQTQLVLNMLQQLSLLGYKRYGCNVMIPVTINGVYTYSWKKKCTIEDFVWQNINSHINSENFDHAMASKGNIPYCIDFLSKCNQHEFQDLIKERRIHAFNNAIYITATMDERGLFHAESHVILFSETNPADDPLLMRMTRGGKVAACFHDCDFPYKRGPNGELQAYASTFEKISTHQRWTEDVKEWFRAACGRMLHPIASTPSPLTLEKWQVFFLLLGVGNSGKSTTIDNVVYNFFDSDDVAYIQNNLEKQYGWSKCKNKYIWLAPEITGNFAEHCDQAQFQQVVEGGRLASAKKYAVDTIDFDPFDLPGMMGANETINFNDNGESVSRRRVDFWFGLPIQNVDPKMPEKLKQELGHIIYSCNEAYLRKTKEVKSRIWDSLPEYFLDLRKENAANTNSLEHFLQNGRLEYHPEYYMTQTEFQRLYIQHTKVHELPRKTLKKDYTQGPFQKRGIDMEKGAKKCLVDGVKRSCMWVIGIKAMCDDAFVDDAFV
jgi:hypothetical protein